MKKDKSFDCVEMQHRGAEEVKKKIDGMTFEQQVEFWQKGTEELRRKQDESKRSPE